MITLTIDPGTDIAVACKQAVKLKKKLGSKYGNVNMLFNGTKVPVFADALAAEVYARWRTEYELSRLEGCLSGRASSPRANSAELPQPNYNIFPDVVRKVNYLAATYPLVWSASLPCAKELFRVHIETEAKIARRNANFRR